ncbi:MAG TPA: DUF2264 domain-containing protein, partial [Polyangia bacterium]
MEHRSFLSALAAAVVLFSACSGPSSPNGGGGPSPGRAGGAGGSAGRGTGGQSGQGGTTSSGTGGTRAPGDDASAPGSGGANQPSDAGNPPSNDARPNDASEAGGGAGGNQPPANNGPIVALTFEAARDTLFDWLAGAYKYLEPKGVNSRLPGRYTRWQSGQDPELITRTMEALGAWLSRPSRPASVMTTRGAVNVEEVMARALANGSDPSSGVTWQTQERGQLDVESSHIAWATYVAGDRILNKLTEAQRTNLQNWLFNHTFADVQQNWTLFYVVTNAFLKSRGWRHDATGMSTLLNRAYGFYKGNGWYTDGATNVFDDYNSTVFSTHFAEWAIMLGNEDTARRREVLMRLRRYNEDQPYFFATRGMHPEFGRSTSYKTARLTGLILSYHIDQAYGAAWNLGFKVLPEEITRGMLRRLIREHINYYLRNGTYDPATGVLNQR